MIKKNQIYDCIACSKKCCFLVDRITKHRVIYHLLNNKKNTSVCSNVDDKESFLACIRGDAYRLNVVKTLKYLRRNK